MLLDDEIISKEKLPLDKDLDRFKELHQFFAWIGGIGLLGLVVISRFLGVEVFTGVANVILYIAAAYIFYYRILIVNIQLFRERFHFGFFLVNTMICLLVLASSFVIAMILGGIVVFVLSSILGNVFSSFWGMGHELVFIFYWIVCWRISGNILRVTIDGYYKKNSHLSQG
jgi:hypothetical protein